MSDSYIGYNKEGQATSFVGEQAVDLFRAAALMQALGFYAIGMKMKAMTATQALKFATQYTKKPYKRGQHAQAKLDMQEYLDKAKQQVATVNME